MNESIKEQLELTFKDVVVTIPQEARMVVNIQKDQVSAVLRFLKDRRFDHLALVSCVDWIEEKEFEIRISPRKKSLNIKSISLFQLQ